MEKLKKLGGYLSALNFYILNIPSRTLLKERNLGSKRFLTYRNLFVRCSQNLDLLYEGFYLLLYSDPVLSKMSIPNEYWSEAKRQVEEHQIEYENKSYV